MRAQTIFITGAAAGIGCETARLFHARGWQIGVYDVNARGVERLVAELGPGASGDVLDVTDAEAFAQALHHFAVRHGRLDVLLNNAGILSVGDFESIDTVRHALIVDINLKGVINGCHAALPWLRHTPDSRVINLASASAIYGTPAYASYSATKFAVRGLSEALNIEWQRYDIRVFDLLPLFVNTAMVVPVRGNASVRHLGVRLQASDVAATIWRAANSRRRRRVHWYVGMQSRLMALANKYVPDIVNRAIARAISGY